MTEPKRGDTAICQTCGKVKSESGWVILGRIVMVILAFRVLWLLVVALW